MRRATITLPDDVDEAVERYRARFAAKPSLTAVVQAALTSFLATAGRPEEGTSLAPGRGVGSAVAEPASRFDDVELEAGTRAALRRRAELEGRSESELVELAVRAYVEDVPRPQPLGVGRYRSGRSDISVRAEELLRRASRRRS